MLLLYRQYIDQLSVQGMEEGVEQSVFCGAPVHHGTSFCNTRVRVLISVYCHPAPR